MLSLATEFQGPVHLTYSVSKDGMAQKNQKLVTISSWFVLELLGFAIYVSVIVRACVMGVYMRQ